MKEILYRLAIKLSGHKALFTMAVLAILVLHDLSPDNADVMKVLIGMVLGVKAVQYGKEAFEKLRGGKEEDGDA
jgi:hypothetical protein